MFGHQKLVDFQIFGVDDFKFVSRVNQKIGAFRDFAQGIHHKAGDGFVVFRIWKFLDVQRAHDVGERRGAVHQPGIFGAADDLRLFFGIDQLAHDDAHHVFQRYHADHQRVFVHHHGKVFAGSFEGFQYIVKRQCVGDEQGFAQHALVVGVVTLKDVMSIVMGELVNTEEEPQIIRRTEDTWLVDGATPLTDVMRALDIEEFPNSENYETIAGFMMYSLRKIPKRTDFLVYAGYKFEIIDTENLKIDQLLVSKQGNMVGKM